MKTIMISIKPEWLEKILNGEKTVEVRKFKIKPPFKVVMYCTKENKRLYINSGEATYSGLFFADTDEYMYVANGKVVGEFICNKSIEIECDSEQYKALEKDTCLTMNNFIDYCNGKTLYGYCIDNLIIYDKPKELSGFRKHCIMSEMPYCPACKFGNIKYSSDEVECSRDIEGSSCEWLCTNFVKRPPQNFIYI